MMNPAHLIASFAEMAKMIQAISIIMGVALFAGGMFKLKRYGEMRTFMSQNMTLAAPGMMILAGVMLLIFPTTVATVLHTFWGSDYNPIRYTGNQVGWDQYVPAILIFVRLIGIISMLRGILLISRSGNQGSQPGTIGRAMTHLFGGILLVHILGTVDVLRNIFG